MLLSNGYTKPNYLINYIKKAFYSDDLLKSQARDITIQSYQNDFISIYGQNINVGGKGSVEIQTELDTITGTSYANKNEKGFIIKNKDLRMEFKEDGFHWKRYSTGDEFFEVGKVLFEKDGIAYPNQEYTISHENPNKDKLIDKAGTFTAGRKILLGPYGTSVDLRLEVSKSDLEDIGEAGSSIYTGSDEAAKELLRKRFSFNVKIHVPENDVSISGEAGREIIQSALELNEEALLDFAFKVEGESRKVSKKTSNMLKDLLVQSIDKNNKFESGELNMRMINDPRRNPTLEVSIPGSSKIKPTLNTDQQQLINDILEGSVRIPNLEKGDTSYTHPVQGWLGIPYTTKTDLPPYRGPLVKRLWNNIFGRNPAPGQSTLQFGDQEFWEGEENVFDRNLDKVN